MKKYRNVFTAAQPHMSKLKKSVWGLGTHLINFDDKMKRREKARKFFTLLLLLFLLGIQGVDNFASGEVAATYKTMAKEKRLDQLSISGKKTKEEENKLIATLADYFLKSYISATL